MALARSVLVAAVLKRLGDEDEAIWTAAEVAGYLQDGYRVLAVEQRVFVDRTYLENLPRGFSHTADWEADHAFFTVGLGNYTFADERRLLTEDERVGPANYTSPFEATDGHLEDAGASTAIPATADLPRTVTEIERVLWDRRAIDAMTPSQAMQDSRYETTTGEVYGYLWRQDGMRTVRKVRVPAAQADCYAVDGSWGLLRRPTDITTTAASGTWGIARRIPGTHPMGAESFGAPRRFYRDGKNVRVEHWRYGRPLSQDDALSELPDRYTLYLRDYAQFRCLDRPSAGQDQALAQHYAERWQRGLQRIERRRQAIARPPRGVLGQAGVGSPRRPPRPRLPWAYGSTVR